jgi:uncharacterized protein YhaN
MIMTEATIKIPDNIDAGKISEEIVYRAFAIALEQKKKDIRKELRRVESKIKVFERRYRMPLDQFEQTMGDTFREHEDWMDWSYLLENRNQLLEEITGLEAC